jgi:sulfur carrier protein
MAVATALNGNFVTIGQRVTTTLSDGDQLEVLAPMQGG